MSATVETVLQLVRALCKAIASTSALTDTQVRLMDDPGPRSVPPYLGIRFQNSRGQGYDNTIATMGTTTVTYTGVGARMGSVSIHGYGLGSDEWLESIRARLHLDVARGIIETAGTVEIRNPGDVLNVSTGRDTGVEPHYVLDVEASWVQTVSESVPYARSATINTTLHDDPSNFTASQTEALPLPPP